MFEESLAFFDRVIIDTIHANQNDRDLIIIFDNLYYMVGIYITMTNLYIPYCHEYFFLREKNAAQMMARVNTNFCIVFMIQIVPCTVNSC